MNIKYKQDNYLNYRAILSPLHKQVNEINEKLLA